MVLLGVAIGFLLARLGGGREVAAAERRLRDREERVARLKERLSDSLLGRPTAIDEVVERSVQRALRRLNIPSRAEIDRLHRMIETLTKKIDSLEED
jgi:poly(hydroxyalkanoate) granule-associated protein